MTQSPQEKKIIDLRSTGLSLREIAEMLKISRDEVEKALAGPGDVAPAKTETKPVPQTPPAPKAATKKSVVNKKAKKRG